MKNKYKKSGFTIVELLTVLGIIAILVGVLMPALNLVRNIAKETKQKAQFITIDQAILAYRADFGDYPESYMNAGVDYGGAQKLAEALVGWDLLGFHPYSVWESDNASLIYDSTDNANLDQRVGPYLDVATANVFTLRQLFGNETTTLGLDTFVISDSFGGRRLTVGQTTFTAGNPILYYKADTSSKTFNPNILSGNIYDTDDNLELLRVAEFEDGAADDDHPLFSIPGNVGGRYFYSDKYKIVNPKVVSRDWPYRADSYILISAGADGQYGTNDDITNF